MPKFKVQVSKNQKKYSIVIQSENAKEAREKVHRDGYSVLNIEEYNPTGEKKDRFYFTVDKNGKIKSGSITGDDIFKVYLKLRKDLGYKVIELYKNKDDDDLKKEDLLKNIEDAYKIYEKNLSKQEDKNKKRHQKEEPKEETIDDFYVKKELETTHKLIDFVIAKIETVLQSKNLGNISEEKRDKIEQVYENIIQIKNSTNISKLKEIGELALLRIGQLELEIVEKEKNIYAKEFLKETNNLLKKIGSDKHFIEKDKDIKAQIEIRLNKVRNYFKTLKNHRKNEKKHAVDKTSYDYLKTIALLNRYKHRNRQVQGYILKHFWYYFMPSKKEEFSKLLLTRAVLRQNIIIMKAKKSGKIYSYTKLVKGYEKVFDFIQGILGGLNSYLFAVVAIFSFIFLFVISGNYFLSSDVSSLKFNYQGLYGIILILLFIGLSKKIHGFWSLGICSFMFFSFCFLGSVNF